MSDADWELANWVARNVPEYEIKNLSYTACQERAAKLLDDHRRQPKSGLQAKLEAIAGDLEGWEAALAHAFLMVTRAYCAKSSVYPSGKRWMTVYCEEERARRQQPSGGKTTVVVSATTVYGRPVVTAVA
ncbi:MAG: hypothetical protein WAR37_01235 [Candidatus Microsaccharimonas sp.]